VPRLHTFVIVPFLLIEQLRPLVPLSRSTSLPLQTDYYSPGPFGLFCNMEGHSKYPSTEAGVVSGPPSRSA
jgi:hypothetical protein